jgi:DNA repair exonuclease SbcCD ATPase subunit
MIETLLIRNFQSHKRTELKFDKGVNCIIGPTDSGKTAIIRALQWLFWNTPSGNAFCSDWSENDTTVKILGWQHWNKATDDYFERGIDKKGGYYLHGDVMLRAFGQTIPEEVKKYFNMSEINIQEQQDSPFLLNESPGKIAAFFNKIAGLSKIDTSNQYIQAQIRATNYAISYNTTLLEEKEEELKKYSNLHEADKKLKILEKYEKEQTLLIKSKKVLRSSINDIETINFNLQEVELLIKAEENVNKIIQLLETKTKKIQEALHLSAVILKIKEKNRKITACNNISQAEDKVVNLIQQINNFKSLSAYLSQFKSVINNLQQVNKNSFKIGGKLKQMEDKWVEEFPDTCPLCGSEKKYHKH